MENKHWYVWIGFERPLTTLEWVAAGKPQAVGHSSKEAAQSWLDKFGKDVNLTTDCE